MAFRTGNGQGMPGGKVEYRGDEPVVAPIGRRAPWAQKLSIPAASPTTRSSIVSHIPNVAGMVNVLIRGGVRNRTPIPPGGAGYGNVNRSEFQQVTVSTERYYSNHFWYRAAGGYPRMNGTTFRAPGPVNQYAGPGNVTMGVRPRFSRVQQVERAVPIVGRYPTRGART